MDKMTADVRLEHWTGIVQRCNTSGIPKKQWCIENNVNEKRFYYWQRRIRTLMYQQRVTTTEIVPTVFAEVPVAKTEEIPGVTNEDRTILDNNPLLRLNKDNISIEISNLTGSELLKFTKELLFDVK